MATFEGVIKEVLPVKEFTNSKLIEIVVENPDTKEVALFTAFNEKIDDVKKFVAGQEVEVAYKFTSRNSNGRWWLTARIQGIEEAMF